MTDLFAVAIIAVCFAALAWRSLEWAIPLLLFLLPVYQIRFHVLGLPTTALEVMLLALAAVWILQRFIFNERERWPRWPWRWVTLAWLAAGALAVVVSPDRWAGLGLYRAYLVEPILFFVIFCDIMRSERARRSALLAIGAATLVIGIVSVFQYLHIIPGVEPYISEHPARATGVFAFPTAVGKFVGPVLAFFLALFFVHSPHRRDATALEIRAERGMQSFALGSILLGMVALTVSVSRGALLGVVAAAAVVGLFSRYRRVLWAGLAIGLALILVLPTTRGKIISVVNRTDVSSDVRFVMWKGTARLIEARPIFGAGLAGFPLVYPQYKEASHTEFFPNPDSLILTLWAELGLTGLLAFGWLLVHFVRRLFPTLRDAQSAHRPLAVGLLVMLVVFVVHGFVDTPYFKNDLAVLFWAFAGLAELLPNTGQKG